MRDIFNVARKYHKVLWDLREVQRLHSLNGLSRRFVIAGLSNLSKFIGVYKAWQRIIARLTKVVKGDEIIKWISQVKVATLKC